MSLLVCTEKKNILDLGSGFSVGGVRKRVFLAIFGCFIMTSSPPQRAKILAWSFVVFKAGIWSFRGLDRLPSVSGAQVGAKRPQIVEDKPEYFQGISLIKIRKFGHNFWTGNARKSIKSSKDSYWSLESKKTSSHQIQCLVRLPGSDVIIQMHRNMHEQPLNMQTLTKNRDLKLKFFFSV